jgi:hypothetical protein
MVIRPRLLALDLGPVDELIEARRVQHGGNRGAPKIGRGGERVGAAINKSCLLMLSALLQGYVEDVFMAASRSLFNSLRMPDAEKRYRDTINRWGNPSDQNVIRLFVRLGIVDVLADLSWEKTTSQKIKSNLRIINELRNKIAHGKRLDDTISLQKVVALRDFVAAFSDRFGSHVLDRVI